MRNDRPELHWGGEQRLEVIGSPLFREGHMNRRHLMTQLGLSVNQAASDPRGYIGLARPNMDCDRSLRTYVRQPGFRSVFDKRDAGRYLAWPRSAARGLLDREDPRIAGLPPCDCAPTPARGVDPAPLRSVVDAGRRSETIEVKPQLLSSPEPRWRRIAPHAIASDGLRWHGRALCFGGEVFKDFLRSRIRDLRGARASDVLSEAAQDRHTFAALEIGPRPALCDTPAMVIAHDCGMSDGKAEMRVGRALLYHALRRLGLDTGPAVGTPQDRQIVHFNPDAILGRQGRAVERQDFHESV